jgi:hypothetical protein
MEEFIKKVEKEFNINTSTPVQQTEKNYDVIINENFKY